MSKKEKYICGSCRQEVRLTDEACPHCKAILEPIEDVTRENQKAKSVRDFKVHGRSIPVYVGLMKKALEHYAFAKGLGDRVKLAEARELLNQRIKEAKDSMK